jgi:hypothetical protein
MNKKGWIRAGDVVKISCLSKDSPDEYGLVIRSLSTHYDERYRQWAVLVGGSVKNVAESWIVTLDSK